MPYFDIPERQISLLVDPFKQLLSKLTRDLLRTLASGPDALGRFRLATNNLLDRMEEKLGAWAKKNIVNVLDRGIRGAVEEAGAVRPGWPQLPWDDSFEQMRLKALDDVLWSQETGLLRAIETATSKIRYRLRRVEQLIYSDLDSSSIKDLFIDLYELGGVDPQDINGDNRSIRIDRFVRSMGQTKIIQAFTLGQRIGALLSGSELILISNSASEPESACSLFSGRVFALTPECSELLSIPYINTLPAGGAPFFPTCDHRELMYYPEYLSYPMVAAAMTRPPEWALGRPWVMVQRQYEREGGYPFATKQNPSLQFARQGKWSAKVEADRIRKFRKRAARKSF